MFARVLTAAFIGAASLAAVPCMAQQAAAPNPLDAIPEKMPFDIPYGTPISSTAPRQRFAAMVAEAKKPRHSNPASGAA
jgi:glc operon protein GlcG